MLVQPIATAFFQEVVEVRWHTMMASCEWS
jgi:hypothetical protein